MAEAFFGLSLEDRRELLAAAPGRGVGRAQALLEKDVWVVWALQALFTAPFGGHLVFKGGTSLSKAHNLIQRFSEDVDLTYDIRTLTDDPKTGEPTALTEAQAKALGRKIRERLLARFLGETVKPYLEALAAAEALPMEVSYDGENLFIAYAPAADYPVYVRPTVKLEFGAWATGEPAEPVAITCYLAEPFPDIAFPKATARVMRPERTFWEKATLAHVYCREGKLRGAAGFARHWHDLVRLDEAGVAATALADRSLALAVADHKSKFFPQLTWTAPRSTTQPPYKARCSWSPKGDAYSQLAADYGEMIAAGYLEREAEPFAALMDKVRTLESRANSLPG